MKITRFATAVLAVALVALLASDVFAQPQGRQRGGGAPGGQFGGRGGGGPGGFGGGFGGRGGGADVLGLLRLEPVQTELQISPDQEEAIAKLAEQARGGQRGERPDFQNMTDDERREYIEQRTAEMRAQAQENKEMLEEVLLPEQMERLDQIALQLRGIDALNDEEVAGKLKISGEQKTKLRDVQEEQRNAMMGKMRELFQSGDRENMREAMGKLRDEMEEAILGVLTSDQRKEFDEMKGEPFEMPEGVGRGGPGGGRGGFGGGPGGGRGGFGGGAGGRGGEGGGRGGRPGRPPVEE